MLSTNAYAESISNFYTPEEELALLDLSMPDDKLIQMVRISLDNSRDYWNQAPWSLEEIDKQAMPYIFNQKQKPNFYQIPEDDYSDNRLFRGMRSIRAYVTSRLAIPELSSSKTDDHSKRQAAMIGLALYQHTMDEHVDQKIEAAFMNHFFRKRAFLKLRFDLMEGVEGDVVTDSVPPEDIVIDQYATYMGRPLRIHQRIRCSLDELCGRFPSKRNQIYSLFSVKQGRFTQLSREVTYYETWFTYLDAKGYPREGVCWWLSSPGSLVLDKQPNPNWIYTGDDKKDREINLLSRPPKPFIGINYLNMGRSYIDETCLFEHAMPQQDLLDKRQKQWHKNIDYVNGRWIADKNKLSEGEATKMVNKGARTIGMIDNKEGHALSTIFANIASQPLPSEVYQSIIDTRNEVDDLLGVNSIFKGAQPGQQGTLGRDMLQNQQASGLQDDYVKAVAVMMQQYYSVKLQMFRVYWTKDQTIQTKGPDGSDVVLTLSGSMIDRNVKIGVQTDSMLPVNKDQLRNDAMNLLKANKIDYLTAMEDMGLPNPEIRTERFLKSQLQPYVYMQSVEKGIDNNDAESDIQLILRGKEPLQRDSYDESYMDYYNAFVTTNRFAQLEQGLKQSVIAHLALVQHMAATQANLQQSMLDEAGMMDQAPFYPPKVTVRLNGNVDPNAAASMASGQLPQAPTPPTAQGQTQPQQPQAPQGPAPGIK